VNLGSDSLGKSNDLGISSVSWIHFGFGFIVNPDLDSISNSPLALVTTNNIQPENGMAYFYNPGVCSEPLWI